MIKKLIRRIVNSMGVDIVRYTPPATKQSKRTDKLTLHKTDTGNYYLPTDAVSDVVANAIIANQIFEKDVVNIISKYIKPGTTVLDVGANFGQMSILFSNMVGSNGNVHSFEADDWVYHILTKNIEANSKQNNIIAHLGAVHDKSGEVLYFPIQDFERFQTYGSYGIDYKNQKGREIKTIRIDDFNYEFPVSFMKVDIQGGDLLAMKGAVNTIKKNQMPIIFEYEFLFEEELGLSFQEYVDFVDHINYKFERVINGQNFLIIPKNQQV